MVRAHERSVSLGDRTTRVCRRSRSGDFTNSRNAVAAGNALTSEELAPTAEALDLRCRATRTRDSPSRAAAIRPAPCVGCSSVAWPTCSLRSRMASSRAASALVGLSSASRRATSALVALSSASRRATSALAALPSASRRPASASVTLSSASTTRGLGLVGPVLRVATRQFCLGHLVLRVVNGSSRPHRSQRAP